MVGELVFCVWEDCGVVVAIQDSGWDGRIGDIFVAGEFGREEFAWDAGGGGY